MAQQLGTPPPPNNRFMEFVRPLPTPLTAEEKQRQNEAFDRQHAHNYTPEVVGVGLLAIVLLVVIQRHWKPTTTAQAKRVTAVGAVLSGVALGWLWQAIPMAIAIFIALVAYHWWKD